MPKELSSYCLLVVLAIFPTPAHAYLDPGPGSMILQILLGGAAGVFVIVGLYWQRFVTDNFGI